MGFTITSTNFTFTTLMMEKGNLNLETTPQDSIKVMRRGEDIIEVRRGETLLKEVSSGYI
jgi:hypothetical protein